CAKLRGPSSDPTCNVQPKMLSTDYADYSNRCNLWMISGQISTLHLSKPPKFEGHGSCKMPRRRLRHMKLAYSSKSIGGYLLAFFLLFGILTVASSSAQAQWRDRDRDRRDDRWERRDRDDRYRDRNYGNYSYQTARQQGYSYGLNVGAADAQRGQSYNP